MKTIMTNNIFKFGDLYFLKILGTTMGTLAVVMRATLYYTYHKVHIILTNHGHNLCYFKRFIDVIFGIWAGNLTSNWDAFCEDIDNFGILKWDISTIKPSTSVNFLDMTLTIEQQRIVPRTYQQEMYLHLYISAMSEHQPGYI